MKNILLILFLCGFILGCSSNNNSESGKNSVAGYPVVKEFDLEDTVSEKSEYELLIEGSKLVGRWKMEFTIGNIKPRTIEFYERDNKYFEIWITQNPYSVLKKKLVQQDGRYLCEKEGEYYIISKNGNLKSYDEEGYIGEEFGFRYVKY